ncbi:hypothetical protein FHS27_003772 [Rhodopirellula rubra]|uniref:Uncharacterized protein n=1 Tax=Aporhodopirellula rubra TaxID=980271 RepID=A0A7W5E0N2_9BACT|nr:hypothetical protein [Aporhodopirellula rubra]
MEPSLFSCQFSNTQAAATFKKFAMSPLYARAQTGHATPEASSYCRVEIELITTISGR